MLVADCGAVEKDATGKELVVHGDSLFPLAIYQDHLHILPVDWHWHEELEIIYQIEGEGLYAINDTKVILKEGEGLFINSEALHGCWDTKLHCSEICSVVFHPRLLSSGNESIFWQKYLEPFIHNPSFLFYHFHDGELEYSKDIKTIWEICREGRDGYEFKVRNKLSDLILFLCQKQSTRTVLPSAREIRNNERMKMMLNYIHNNYEKPIRVNDIAGSAMISESECLRCFREIIRTSPGQYLKHYRISKACEQLKNSSRNISQIGELCGFSDESYFVKQFRQEMGMSPGVFRNQSAVK